MGWIGQFNCCMIKSNHSFFSKLKISHYLCSSDLTGKKTFFTVNFQVLFKSFASYYACISINIYKSCQTADCITQLFKLLDTTQKACNKNIKKNYLIFWLMQVSKKLNIFPQNKFFFCLIVKMTFALLYNGLMIHDNFFICFYFIVHLAF